MPALLELNEEVRALDIIIKEKKEKHQEVNREISASNGVYSKVLESTKSVRAEKETLSTKIDGLRQEDVSLIESIKKQKEDYLAYQARINQQIEDRASASDAKIASVEKAVGSFAAAQQKAQTARAELDSKITSARDAVSTSLEDVAKILVNLRTSLK